MPVARLVTVHCLLTMIVAQHWEIYQLDVHNVFLHGNLDEEVYMSFPLGFSSSHVDVCWLYKSIYGFRQASRNWFDKLSKSLKRNGFAQAIANHSLSTLSRGDIFLAMLVYVDDLVVVGNNSRHCCLFKEYLS